MGEPFKTGMEKMKLEISEVLFSAEIQRISKGIFSEEIEKVYPKRYVIKEKGY